MYAGAVGQHGGFEFEYRNDGVEEAARDDSCRRAHRNGFSGWADCDGRWAIVYGWDF